MEGNVGKDKLEFILNQGESTFAKVKMDWIEVGTWALPYTTKWLMSTTEGARNNRHLADPSHLLSLRSCVAGFMEGNTSATRPWFQIRSSGEYENLSQSSKRWLEIFTSRVRRVFNISNFYHASAGFYYHYNVYNTGTYWIEELENGRLFYHLLIPGSYTLACNSRGEHNILTLTRCLTVRQVVDEYGIKKAKGGYDFSNISDDVKKMYDEGNYNEKVTVVSVTMENPDYDTTKPVALLNKQWITYTYERGGSSSGARGYDTDLFTTFDPYSPKNKGKYLRIEARSRKPFIAGAGHRNNAFPYGETGPTTEVVGLIKSLTHKAIAKDQALEQMLRPAVQGPANLNRSYITTAANSFVPLDPTSAKPGGGLRQIFEINPAFGSLLQDQADLRRIVDKFYYADFLLFLSNNPKTRTAAEANAIVQEQQTVIGPQLQSLNMTHNVPNLDYAMDYVLENDPEMPPPPEELQGEFLRAEITSIFAQATRAADLPNINQYVSMIMNIAQLDPGILQKANLDKVADLYEDRLYLPTGLNNPQDIVDARREQQQAMQARDRMIEEQLPAVAGAAKDVGLTGQPQQ